MALTAGKAKKMLEDGTVHGRALTDKQKRYFGAIAGGATPMKKINGGWLDKYAMGGTLPGASGMMYARTNTPEPLYTQSEMKAQRGKPVAIDSTRVNIPTIERFDSPKFPFTEGLQQLDEVVVTAPRRRQPMISQGRPRGNESLQRIQEDDTSLPMNAMPLTYLANPFRLIGDVYNATVVPVGNYFSPYDNFQPITGNFFTSDEVARQLNNRKLQYQRGQITKGEQLYGNLKQALPETAFALLNVGGARAYSYLKNTKLGQAVSDTFKNFFNPSAAPIGRDTVVPQIFNRTSGPPNRLMSNPKMDADNFMKSWTNAPGFNARFESQIRPYNPLPSLRPEYIESTIAARTRQLQTLQSELAKYEVAGLQNALPKSRYLQQQIDDLTMEINQMYNLYYPGLARQNIKAIQAGEFPTTYSSAGFTPGSGGTYYVPTANQPLNTLKTFDDAASIGNKSVVKLGEVSPRASNRLKEIVRTREMLTGIHETLGHASNIGGRALSTEAKELIKGALKRDPKILKGTNKSIEDFLGPGSTFEDYAKYLQDPTEMVARVMELRRLYINPKYWGTNKQYDIPDKLIEQIFRDGLGGRTPIASDFFRVVDKKGLKKLMKGLYAAIPMGYNAQGLLEYKHGGKAQNGEVLGFDNVLDYVVKTRGGDRDTWGAVADTIAFHESGPRQRMNPKARQYPKGPGRGVFQFEGPSFITAQNRYKTVANVMGVDVNPNILNAKSADELSLKDQYTLFYVNMLEGPAQLAKYPKGEIDLIDLWLDGHKLIESEGNRESFLESQREAQEKGIEGGYKTFKTGGWLDKYEVIEDDMGQLTNPGKITKINSNNITMKGVDFPVLGISDTGDKKMMLPGKDYKFDGNSVTEYPMAQEGETIDASEQIEFLKNWNMSNRGQELLSNSFKGNQRLIDDRTFKRNTFLDNVKIEQADGNFLGRYNRGPHRIQMDSSNYDGEAKYIGKGPDDVLLHELSHSQDYGGKYNNFAKLNMPLSDVKLINSLNKTNIRNKKNTNELSKGEVKDLKYIGDPSEVRARLNAIRYFYETEPQLGGKAKGLPSIFDSEVTPEMQETMKINEQYQDLKKLYSDDEINMLLNTISDNSQSSGPSNIAYAQEGGGLNKEGVEQYKFLKSYMNSQKYQDRLKKEFPDYTDKQIAEEAKTRLNNVMQTRVSFLPESSEYSTSNQDIQGVYNRFGNKNIQFRPEYSALTPENPLFSYNTTPIHEFAHAADEGGERIPQSTKDLMFRSTKDNSLGLPKQEYYYTQPTEVLGRMQELRYLLNDQGIYDARKDTFTQEDLDKARKNFRIKNNARFQDLEDSVESDEALIELMNSIAAVNQDSKQQTMTAKQGRSLVTLDQLTNFTNYNTPQPGGWLDKYN
jgi:hypothetical protein|tara:strand:- start:2481 stop:6605 length:4125 start_codon:yes stop_codon:yes gene_type:complete